MPRTYPVDVRRQPCDRQRRAGHRVAAGTAISQATCPWTATVISQRAGRHWTYYAGTGGS